MKLGLRCGGRLAGLLRGHVARHLEEHRPLPRPERDPDRAIGGRPGVCRAHASLPFRDRGEQRAEVQLLVGHALVAVDRQLAGERNDRRAVEVGVGDAGDEVRGARTECGEARAGASGAAGHGLGHEGRTGLVLREDEFKAARAESFDEVDDLAAGVAEDVAHAGRP